MSEVDPWIEAVEDQFTRLDGLWRALDERRTQTEEAERALGQVDGRLQELRRLSDDVDRTIEAITDREQVVETVRRHGSRGTRTMATSAASRAEPARPESSGDPVLDPARTVASFRAGGVVRGAEAAAPAWCDR